MTIDPFSTLSKNVAFLIFNKLSLEDLAYCCEVSKKVKALAGSDQLWKQYALDLHLAPQTNYRLSVGKKIVQLKRSVAIAEPLLNREVEKYNLLLKNIESDNQKEKTLANAKYTYKQKWEKTLLEGVDANLYLKKIGLSTAEKVEALAKILTEKYECSIQWVNVAQAYVDEGNYERANEIIDTFLNEESALEILKNLIFQSSKNGNFKTCFKFLRKMFSYEQLLAIRPISLSIKLLIQRAQELNNPFIEVELLKEGLIPFNQKAQRVLDAIQNSLRRADTKTARKLLSDHSAALHTLNENRIPDLIAIHLKLNQTEEAKKLALDTKTSLESAYKILNQYP